MILTHINCIIRKLTMLLFFKCQNIPSPIIAKSGSRELSVRSCSDIWQTTQQYFSRSNCDISERSDNFKLTSRDMIRSMSGIQSKAVLTKHTSHWVLWPHQWLLLCTVMCILFIMYIEIIIWTCVNRNTCLLRRIPVTNTRNEIKKERHCPWIRHFEEINNSFEWYGVGWTS